MGEHMLDDAVRLIVWAVRRTLHFDDAAELRDGPAWLAERLAATPLGPDVLRLTLREAVRVLEDEEEYAAALALAARFASDCDAHLRRIAAA
jgi:hypothetical protein